MFRKIDFRSSLITGAIAAILFCIPVYIFIVNADYRQSWLLYMGSFVFGIVMWVHILKENKKRKENESTVAFVFASHVVAVIGVLIATFLCFVLLVILVPGYFDSGMAGKQLINEPPQIVQDKTNGLSFEVFMTATIINFSVGSFAGIILPFYAKRNQIKDSKDPAPLHQQGAK